MNITEVTLKKLEEMIGHKIIRTAGTPIKNSNAITLDFANSFVTLLAITSDKKLYVEHSSGSKIVLDERFTDGNWITANHMYENCSKNLKNLIGKNVILDQDKIYLENDKFDTSFTKLPLKLLNAGQNHMEIFDYESKSKYILNFLYAKNCKTWRKASTLEFLKSLQGKRITRIKAGKLKQKISDILGTKFPNFPCINEAYKLLDITVDNKIIVENSNGIRIIFNSLFTDQMWELAD